MSTKDPAERAVRDIRRKTRKQYSAEAKIRIVVSGLRGEESIASLCRHDPARPSRLSLSRQCQLVSISRSAFYYTPKGESPGNLALMRRIDELFLKYPFYGKRPVNPLCL